MPNHVSNYTEITGPVEDLKKIAVIVTPHGVDEKEWGLSNLFPCPEPLYEARAEFFDLTSELVQNKIKTGEITPEMIDEIIESTNISKQNVKKYGHPNWYSWCVSNWGTKWGDYDHSDFGSSQNIDDSSNNSTITFGYSTAWGPFEDTFWEKVSADYPNCTFVTEFNEPGMMFLGVSVAYKGVCFIDSEEIEFSWGEDGPDDTALDNYYESIEEQQEKLKKDLMSSINNLYANTFVTIVN